MTAQSYNVGEWSEVYIFFKILTDSKIHTADADFKPRKDVWIDVLGILREEKAGEVYKYMTGDKITILLNNHHVKELPKQAIIEHKDELWRLLQTSSETTFHSQSIADFLRSIFINKPKAPSKQITRFCGGTADIVLEIREYSGITRTLGFSCKSNIRSAPTLLNASGANTNFRYKIAGGHFTDTDMATFNRLVNSKGNISAGDRMRYLHDCGCDLQFVEPCKEVARENLIKCGGMEMPSIIGGMLKLFYFINYGSQTGMHDCVRYMVEHDTEITDYRARDLQTLYRIKVADFLWNTFTGMKLGTPWNGKQEATGGYIDVQQDGEILALHSTIADDFKDFLMNAIRFESPSHKRHNDMVIYKQQDGYYVDLALQLRFQLNKSTGRA